MSKILGKAVLAALALALVATSLHAQGRNRREQRRPAEPAVPTVPTDKRDSLVGAPGPYSGRPYWLALAECGGIYFKLNVLYTDVAVRARVVKPDPRVNAEYTKKLTEAIKTATIFFNGAERFLMTDRGLTGSRQSTPGRLRCSLVRRFIRPATMRFPNSAANYSRRRVEPAVAGYRCSRCRDVEVCDCDCRLLACGFGLQRRRGKRRQYRGHHGVSAGAPSQALVRGSGGQLAARRL
jgi:hypothetical protein